jgi:hypothetical protein
MRESEAEYEGIKAKLGVEKLDELPYPERRGAAPQPSLQLPLAVLHDCKMIFELNAGYVGLLCSNGPHGICKFCIG